MKLTTLLLLPTLALSAALVERTPDADADAAIEEIDLHTHDARATICGSGYTLDRAIPLPKGVDPNKRKATIYAYGNGHGKGCVFLDNNVGKKQYMSIKVCKSGNKNCDSDAGNFGQYAGPVYVSSFACAPVTAKMGSSSSNLYVNYKSDYVFPCN